MVKQSPGLLVAAVCLLQFAAQGCDLAADDAGAATPGAGALDAGVPHDSGSPQAVCKAIQAHAGWEVCQSTPTSCSGVYRDGAGCTKFCAAAGMICTGAFGGDPGCLKDPNTPEQCESGNKSDWCECAFEIQDAGTSDGGPLDGGAGDTGAEPSDAGNPNEPIKLHPDNPHYFLFRGNPTVLVTSGEHYGAVMNLDFDYVTYLNTLQAAGVNLTRTFSGMYVEGWGEPWNTLNPPNNRYITLWARSSTGGYPDGGNKFDLNQWDSAYFARLKDFVAQAGNRGIVVELVLFCAMYGDGEWNLSPLKSSNNVNGVGNVARDQIYNLSNAAVTAVQDAMTAKLVAELNSYDNVYYEMSNEPYFGNTTHAWHQHIAQKIVDTEAGLPRKHLIAQNIANGSAAVTNPIPSVSIFNFHYSNPPDSVGQNYGLNKVIAFDETGGGSGDSPYRKEAWSFIVAGGAVYNNLDWSYTVAAENGTDMSSGEAGGPTIRAQLRILKDFIHGFEFLKMAPNNGVIKGGLPSGVPARALVEVGKQYAIYLNGGSQANIVVELPAGNYHAEWVNTENGNVDHLEDFAHGGGNKTLASPGYSEDIALRIR